MTDGDDYVASSRPPESTDQGEIYSFVCDAETLGVCLAEALAWVNGVEPTELPPLYTVIDTEALETLYDGPREKRPTVSFSFAGCEVQITPDLRVTVREQRNSNVGELTRPSNILVCETAQTQSAADACTELFSLDPPQRTNILHVTVCSADTTHSNIRPTPPDTQPANRGLLTVGGFTRSDSTNTSISAEHSNRLQVATVSDPGDLVTLGVRIEEFLAAWDDNDAQTVLCFHSLESLLTHTNLAHLFGFLLVLTTRLRQTETTAHYHLETTAVNARTRATLAPLFESRLEYDQLDGWVHRK